MRGIHAAATAVAAMLAAPVASDEAGARGTGASMSRELVGDLAVVRQARVYFLHHSVGRNVIAGIAALDRAEGSATLRIEPVAQAVAVEGPVFADGTGGRNGDPASKIEAFAAELRGRPGLRPGLAFMKLCYVDFNPGTDVEALFVRYRGTLEALAREFPGVRFAHVTVPLRKRPTDAKSVLRRTMGLEVWEDVSNAKRADFNRRLREAFPAAPIFDLAAVEATGPDGQPSDFELDGRRVPALHPAYTDDGGHLNATGQRVAGAAAIRFLASALRAAGAR